MTTYSQWTACWRELGVAESGIDPGLYETLCGRYSEANRHYHTLQHLNECLGHFAGSRLITEHPGEVALALWFHDAIYEPTQHDNEQLSAEWALASVKTAGLNDTVGWRIHQLVMATRHQEPPNSVDAQIMLDCDLAILGTNPERFAEYEQQIRAEYAFVPTQVFKEKRREILQHFLARPTIFYTDQFTQRYDAQARANLTHAISLLT